MMNGASCEIVDEYLINTEVYFDVCNRLSGIVHRMVPAKDLASDDELGVVGFSSRDIARIMVAAHWGFMESTTFH